ncbi:M12 family metallopeptidase [Streptomyces sp. NPDC093252]|uniref:beta-glucuronidase AbsR1 n=1 Tax=Streptomyces sp. NPDC093252 TaxID=3154980 RepID=UPI0034240B67
MTGRYCSLAQQPAPAFAPGLAAERLSALVDGRAKWVNGTVLHYYFFDRDTDASVIPVPGTGETRRVGWVGAEEQRAVVRECFAEWQGLGIGLSFTEVDDRSEAELRIGFQRGDGSWSTVGRDALRLGQNERTANFGWDLTTGGERATALHEIGHALGMLHEHQSPFAGIHWDDEAVYAELAGPPNFWDRDTTFHNILRKLDRDEVNGSVWDPQSIMEYPFPSGLILEPEQFRAGVNPPGTLSVLDKEFVLRWYPSVGTGLPEELVPFRSAPVRLGPGEQADFRIEPTQTREYTVGIFGDGDAVAVLFEERDGVPRFVAGDDDGGAPHNATVRARLVKGRRYFVRVRLYSGWGSGETAVMCW